MNPAGGMRLGYIGLLQWVKCWQFVHNLCCQWPRMVESPRRGCSSHFGTMLFAQKRWDCFGAEVMAVYSLQAIPTRTVSKRKSGTQATAGWLQGVWGWTYGIWTYRDSFMIHFRALVTFSLSPCLAQRNPPNQQTHPKATDSLRFRAPNGQPSRPLSLPFLSRTLGEPSGSRSFSNVSLWSCLNEDNKIQ